MKVPLQDGSLKGFTHFTHFFFGKMLVMGLGVRGYDIIMLSRTIMLLICFHLTNVFRSDFFGFPMLSNLRVNLNVISIWWIKLFCFRSLCFLQYMITYLNMLYLQNSRLIRGFSCSDSRTVHLICPFLQSQPYHSCWDYPTPTAYILTYCKDGP